MVNFFQANTSILEPRSDITPSQQILVVRCLPDHPGRHLASLRWGLIPAWAKDLRVGNRLVFARAETAASKPAFREAFRQRRCLVPADGFYVWKRGKGKKEPYHVHFQDGRVFAFAGLWDRWPGPEEIEFCAILTTPANELVRPFKGRMPAIVGPKDWERWLDPGCQDPEEIQGMLRLWPAEGMEVGPLSSGATAPEEERQRNLEPVPKKARNLGSSEAGPTLF
ncbi:MAG: SOS response-associated peptidase [Planctomycetes bacterium]|nr:SOS response-associated peptidase [Planctomycetota bacterium]